LGSPGSQRCRLCGCRWACGEGGIGSSAKAVDERQTIIERSFAMRSLSIQAQGAKVAPPPPSWTAAATAVDAVPLLELHPSEAIVPAGGSPPRRIDPQQRADP
jgi:hypothetical protein